LAGKISDWAAKEKKGMRDRSSFKQSNDKKSNPPSALLIFQDGFDSLPLVVPNGGSEVLDAEIMNWIQRKLSQRDRQKRAAA
jgi:hypothetical protein